LRVLAVTAARRGTVNARRGAELVVFEQATPSLDPAITLRRGAAAPNATRSSRRQADSTSWPGEQFLFRPEQVECPSAASQAENRLASESPS